MPKKLLSAWLFFAGLGGALLWRPLINGLSLVPWQLSYLIDNLYRPGSKTILDKYPNSSLLFDVAFQFYPWSRYTLNRIGGWDIPLWNPYSLAGLPFLANHQSSVFELTKLFAYGLKLEAVWLPTFSWWLTITLSGFFTFLFLREMGLGSLAAVVGGTSFALSGPMVAWLGWPHSSTALWLPFLLLGVEKILKGANLSWISCTAAGVAFLLFAGHLQIAWFVIFTCLSWTVFRILTLRPQEWRRVSISLAAAALLGLGLASIQLWPTLEFVEHSSLAGIGRGPTQGMDLITAARTGRLVNPHGYRGLPQSALNLGLFVYPELLGSSRTAYLRPPGNINEAAIYVGIVSLALALTGLLLNRTNRRRPLFWAGLTIISVGVAWSIPGPAAVSYLPIFKLTNTGRIRYIIVFALSVLAANGVDTIFGEDNQARRRTSLAVFMGLTAGLSLSVFAFLGFSALLGNEQPTADMLRSEASVIGIILATAALITFLSFSRGEHRRTAARALLAIVIAGELLSYGIAQRGGIDSRLVAPRRPALDWLQKFAGIDRVTSFKVKADNRTALFPNTSVIFGLQDIRGYEVINVGRFERLQYLVAGKDTRTSYKNYNRDFFDLTGVRYFIQSKNDPDINILEANGLALAYVDEETAIYSNDHVLPRAFIVYNTVNAESADTALRWFKEQKIDFRKRAIVENGPVLRNGGRLAPAGVTDYRPESVTVSVDAARRGLLVLTDTYFPGWQAFVDGKRARIYPADVAFRGVFVKKGRHRITFIYRPASYRRSLYVFFPSLAIVLGLLGLEVVRARRPDTTQTKAEGKNGTPRGV